MLSLSIRRIILFVKDMDRARVFYGEVLGLKRIDSADDSDDFVSFEAGSVHLALHRIPERHAREIEISDPPRAREATPIKFAFGAADVGATRAELISRGADMGPLRRFGSLELCDGVDPEGNVFQLSNRP